MPVGDDLAWCVEESGWGGWVVADIGHKKVLVFACEPQHVRTNEVT